MTLTPKQKAFCDAYIANKGNATQAAIEAGYSRRTARTIGAQNLSKLNIQEYIRQRTEAIEESLVARGDEVLKYLTEVMRGEDQEQSVVVYDGGVSVIEHTDQRNRIKAAELLAKFHGLMSQKVEHEVEVGIVFVDDLPDDDEEPDDGG